MIKICFLSLIAWVHSVWDLTMRHTICNIVVDLCPTNAGILNNSILKDSYKISYYADNYICSITEHIPEGIEFLFGLVSMKTESSPYNFTCLTSFFCNSFQTSFLLYYLWLFSCLCHIMVSVMNKSIHLF